MIKTTAPFCFQNESRNWGLPNLPIKNIFFLHRGRCTDADMHNIFSQTSSLTSQEEWKFKSCPKNCCYDLRPREVGNLFPQAMCLYMVGPFYRLYCHFFSLNHSSYFFKLARLQHCHWNDVVVFFIVCVWSDFRKSYHFHGPLELLSWLKCLHAQYFLLFNSYLGNHFK